MKNIKLIGPAYPFRGGIAAFNERLVREFLRSGQEAEIETFTLQYPSFLFPGKSQYSGSPAPEGLTIRRTVNSVNPLNWMKVGARIRKEEPGILLLRYWLPFMAPCLGTIARIVRKNEKTRIICLVDNIVPHEKHPGSLQLTSFFLNSVDGLVAMSESVRNDAFRFRRDLPVRLCPHPLYDTFGDPVERDFALEKLGLDPSFRYILFFGFIRDYKGLDLLLDAFADEKLRKYPVKLIVAGEFYTDSRPYFDQIRRLNLSEYVVLRNRFISDEEVSLFFSAADMIVQPYKTATQSGITQIGYHFNKPMLVTSVGGLPEMVADRKIGYVVRPEAGVIAEAIADFFENDRKKIFEENVRTEKQKFLWPNMVSAILEVSNQCRKNKK